MSIQWDKDETKETTPWTIWGRGPLYTDIDDVMAELNNVSLSDSKDDTKKSNKNYEVGMAKLHSVLSKTKTSERTYLKLAEIRARHARQSIVKAWEIVRDAREAAASSPSSKTKNVNVFPFLALPPELRLLVYQELLTTDDRVIMTWRGPRKADKNSRDMYPDILMTCKKCADEGAEVLYGRNLFDFGEIRHRPFFWKTVSLIINPKNVALIRLVIAEYPAAYEALAQLDNERDGEHRAWNYKPRYQKLSVEYITEFLRAFNININQLKLFSISIVPFSQDDPSMKLRMVQAPHLPDAKSVIDAWVDSKNAALADLIEGVCEREGKVKKVAYKKVLERVPFDWNPPFEGRHWVEYVEETGQKKHRVETTMKVEVGGDGGEVGAVVEEGIDQESGLFGPGRA